MRAKLALCVLGLGVLGNAGCTLFHTAARVVVTRTCQALDDCAEARRNRQWAARAWQGVCSAGPGPSFSPDYERGFKDGFTHFLFYGGTGEPPPLPPREYRCLRYQTPAGYQAIEDWFAGYRHGASVAWEGGYRELVTGPSSLRAAGALPPPPPVVAPGPLPASPLGPVVAPPDEETLPPPNKLGPPEAPAPEAIPTSAQVDEAPPGTLPAPETAEEGPEAVPAQPGEAAAPRKGPFGFRTVRVRVRLAPLWWGPRSAGEPTAVDAVTR